MMVRIQQKRRRPSRRAWLLFARRVLLLVGVGALGIWAFVQAETSLYQDYEEWAFERNLEGQPAKWQGYLPVVVPRLWERWTQVTTEEGGSPALEAAVSADEASVDVERPAPPPPPRFGRTQQARATRQDSSEAKPETRAAATEDALSVRPLRQDRSLIGKVAVPRLGLAAMVREGTDDRTLRRAVGHIQGTALPGSPGNVGLAGHRDSFFRGLRHIKRNDRIVMRTLDGNYEYQVESIRIVAPTNTDVLRAGASNELTLVTCFPFNFVGSAPRRYIVKARQVNAPEIVAQAR